MVSLDVVAHEFTHFAISSLDNGNPVIFAPLSGDTESAAIEESFCDIFGILVEHYAGFPNWLQGEDISMWPDGSNGHVRSLSDPTDMPLDENTILDLAIHSPVHFLSPDTYGRNELGSVWETVETQFNIEGLTKTNHHLNGVQNKWFYLLSEGGEGINELGSNYEVCGIGIDRAAKIAFGTLTRIVDFNLVSSKNPNYLEIARISTDAAVDIFGENSYVHQEVQKAWQAVAVPVKEDSNGDTFITEADETIDTPEGYFDLTVRDCNTTIEEGCGESGNLSAMLDDGGEGSSKCNCYDSEGIYNQNIFDSPAIWNCYKVADPDNPFDPSTWNCSGPGTDDAIEATYQEDVAGNQWHNTMSVQIDNTGCVDYIPGNSPAHLEIYWTFARTGEFWPIHWTGNGYGDWEEDTPNDGTVLGGMLTDGIENADIPLNQTIGAGASKIVTFDWLPPNPMEIQLGEFGIKDYESEDVGLTPMLCYLARIQSDVDPMFRETANEEDFDNGKGRIGANVYFNNNIATKNTGILWSSQSNKFAGTVGNSDQAVDDDFVNSLYNSGDIKVTIVNNDVAASGVIDIRFDELGSNGEQLTDYGDLLIYPDKELWIKMETSNFAGQGYEVHDADLEILKMTQGEGFRIDDLNYDGGENRYLGFRFEANAQGKKPPSELLEFKHFLYHTVEYKDPNNGETVNRKGGSGINFKSFIGSDLEEENLLTDASTILLIVPNPTNGVTNLSFQLEEKSQVEINLYNIHGQLVINIQPNMTMEKGSYNKKIDTNRLSAGLYIVKLSVNGEAVTQKVVIK